jgi:hypothetical protein
VDIAHQIGVHDHLRSRRAAFSGKDRQRKRSSVLVSLNLQPAAAQLHGMTQPSMAISNICAV